MTLLRTAAVSLGTLAACAGPDLRDRALFSPLPLDVHSHARPNEVILRHLDLDLSVDFGSREIRGRGRFEFLRLDPTAPLVLDAAPGLIVERVAGTDGEPLTFQRGNPDPVLGTAISIPLRARDDAIDIEWRTGPDAAAVQWLDPAQTAGGAPFLFTQGQAILTRTWIPLQDTPGVRVTWSATVRTPGQTALAAVMSAGERTVLEPGVTRFAMRQPIPSYLIALAIGQLEQRPLSPRCAVWAEGPLVDRAAAEFEDVESMVQAVESLYGPYRWGRYDILVLPASFPFGGMENPCMTFATPTILAGDKSLVALIAHELAHSWSGNLVTNATWRDFWLNEGFTVYVEQRIVEALYGVERARAETRIGLAQLDAELLELPSSDQVLHIDLAGRNPDDGMSAIAYDKGAAFLRRIEQAVGRSRFDTFLRAWFDEHAFQSLVTADFLRFLNARLPDLSGVDIAAWVTGPGLPADCPRPPSILLDAVDAAAARYATGEPATGLGAAEWTTTQWLHFLGSLPATTARERLAELDRTYELSASGNSEILAAWLQSNLAAGYAGLAPQVDARLERFLLEVGRRKFVKPLIAALSKTPDGLSRARAIYRAARPRYHAVTQRTIDQILSWPQDG